MAGHQIGVMNERLGVGSWVMVGLGMGGLEGKEKGGNGMWGIGVGKDMSITIMTEFYCTFYSNFMSGSGVLLDVMHRRLIRFLAGVASVVSDIVERIQCIYT